MGREGRISSFAAFGLCGWLVRAANVLSREGMGAMDRTAFSYIFNHSALLGIILITLGHILIMLASISLRLVHILKALASISWMLAHILEVLARVLEVLERVLIALECILIVII